MHGRGRLTEAAMRAAERRRREDEAPRLIARVPNLASLKFDIEERRPEALSSDVQHIKRVVVESAPALFEIACCDRACKDGGHDITRAVMNELERGSKKFEGDDVCHGSIGSTTCQRVLRFVATAEFK